MRRASMLSFIYELPLVLVGADERRLLVRLDCARRVYNAVLDESLKWLALLRESRDYRAARALPQRTPKERMARATAFRDLHASNGYGSFGAP
jgi:hypothetical protein